MLVVGASARSIFSSAVASDIGLRVNCALMASARYSRSGSRASASSADDDRRQQPAHDPEHEQDDAERAAALRSCCRGSGRRRPPPGSDAQSHRARAATSATAPTSAASRVISRTSRFLMCPISWPITACSSSRFSVSSRPCVTAMFAPARSCPVAKAFGIRVRHDPDRAAAGSRRRWPSPRRRSRAASRPASADR